MSTLLKKTGTTAAFHRERFSQGQLWIERILLQHVRHLALPFPVQRLAVQRHVTVCYFNAATYRVQKCCFPGTFERRRNDV